MSRTLSRVRLVAATTVAFAAGVVFASGLDLTPFGYAQQGGKSTKPTSQEVKPLENTSNAFISISEHVTPAVVSIQVESDARRNPSTRSRGRSVPPGLEQFFDQFEDPRGRDVPRQSSGSGFIVSKDGYILTNNHVVAGADRINVLMTDRRVFKAKLVGRDSTTDVAVIKIDGESSLPTVQLGDDNDVRVGEWVLAIGNPLGLDFTVTAGIVSAKGRGSQELRGLLGGSYSITDFIQTDAAINPGNSGGPLVNTRGTVIGINSAIASSTGYYAGYGFAIPITLAKNVMDDIIAHGRVRRAMIGVTIDDVNSDDATVAGLKEIRGAKVGGYNPTDGTSPAQRAGLEPGDIIITIDGKPVDRVATLQRIVRAHSPGETLDVEAMRYGQKKAFKVKLAEVPSEETVAAAATPDPREATPVGVVARRLGVTAEPVTSEFLRSNRVTENVEGLRVTDVVPNGPSRGKFNQYDVIQEVRFPAPRRTIKSVADLQGAVEKTKDGEILSLLVYNIANQQTRVVNVRVGG